MNFTDIEDIGDGEFEGSRDADSVKYKVVFTRNRKRSYPRISKV
jgi:hypothetical protein